MFDTADWSHRGDYIGKHGVDPVEADEAMADPDRVVLKPDPASRSGRGVRIIGYFDHRPGRSDGDRARSRGHHDRC